MFFSSDPVPTADGTPPSSQFGDAPEPDDVLAGAWRRLHDHEVPLELAHLPHHRELIPAAADALRRHRDGQPTLCRQPMEH